MENNKQNNMPSLVADIQRLEILIDSLDEQIIEEQSPFGYVKKVMTVEEMKAKCEELKKQVSEWDRINSHNILYYTLQSEIINGIVELELAVNYYINNGNLYRVFENKLVEISTEVRALDVNDETGLKKLMNRYEHYLTYAVSAGINIDVIKAQTETAIARNFIGYDIK